MSKAKFTKGPWVALFNGSYWDIGDGISEFAMSMKNKHASPPIELGRMESNAHLIASAPEMYEMLECLSSQLTSINAHIAVNDIEKLLAKARGES